MTTALVLGGARTVWDDVAAAMDLGEFAGVVACNDVGVHWPGPLDVWVSLHCEKFGVWASQRDRAGNPPADQIIGHLGARDSGSRVPACVKGFSDHHFPGQVGSGSSGLFALKVALIDLGFDKAVLCGVPMTVQDGNVARSGVWGGAERHRIGWHQARPEIIHRARSMSGWTAAFLGTPDAEWIKGRP